MFETKTICRQTIFKSKLPPNFWNRLFYLLHNIQDIRNQTQCITDHTVHITYSDIFLWIFSSCAQKRVGGPCLTVFVNWMEVPCPTVSGQCMHNSSLIREQNPEEGTITDPGFWTFDYGRLGYLKMRGVYRRDRKTN